MLRVVFWLWRTRSPKQWGTFRVEHVNRAASMVRANLTLEHELVCITDHDADSGFDSAIRIVPLWDDFTDLDRCWRRLKAFSPEMAEVIGPRFVWIDLDMLVTGNLDPLFDRPEDLVLWRSQTTRCPYNGSMVLMTAGSHPEVYADYVPGRPFSPRYPGSDQAWMAYRLGPDMPTWTREDGVVAYNTHARKRRRGPADSWRIIFFPGTIKSNSDIAHKWTPWVQKMLDRHGTFRETDYVWVRNRRGQAVRKHRIGGRSGVKVHRRHTG